MKNEIAKRRGVAGLGQRAIDYYVDTGLCVFCDADDCAGVPHGRDCAVGELSGVVLTDERRALKALERGMVDGPVPGHLLSVPLREFVRDVTQCRVCDDAEWRQLLQMGIELASLVESRDAVGWARLGEAAQLLNEMTDLEYELSLSCDLSSTLAAGFGFDFVSANKTWKPRVST